MSYDPEKITYFAKTDARGQGVTFGIKAKDRQRHMYVIGKTGMGKSTLLENMAAQDIMSGEGMAFIDPHGSAVQTLLDYIPEHRINDVVYFAPFDMENPISFNVMEDVGADKRHLVVSGLMSTFKKIWVDAWSARMEYILTNALLALIEYPDTTLLSVNRMLADAKYRKQVVDYVKDPAVKAYWVDEFANYTERFAAEALPAIQNKVGQFTGNPLIRNIIGQPHSSFDIRKMMDEKKILLVNLSKGLVGETNADLLGSMLTTRIYLAAMSRADLPAVQMKQMPNFYFYVDEFQSFANATFANILSEARKYHLNLIIAHQYIDQMEEDVRNAVFGNVGTTITFRVGPFDAEHLEKVFEPKFMANDLVNLGFAQIYLTLMIDGIGSAPFSAQTLPPLETPDISFKDIAIAASRRNFAQKREIVEKMVTELHTPKERSEDSADGKGGNKGAFSTPKFGQKVGQDGRNGNGGNRRNGNSGGKGNGNGGTGSKERGKPSFENTILEKLRAETSAQKTGAPVEEHSNQTSASAPVPGVTPVSEESPRGQDVGTAWSERAEFTEKNNDSRPDEAQHERRRNELPQKLDKKKPKRSDDRRRQSERSPQPSQKTEPSTTSTSLEDLRKVLAQISSKDGGGNDRNERMHSKQPENTVQPSQKTADTRPRDMQTEAAQSNENGSNLKSALAAALESGAKQYEFSQTAAKPDSDTGAPQQPTTAKTQPVPHVQQVDPNEISPKELERMMRVTGNDRPPLR